MEKWQLKEVIKELIAMFQEETQEPWSEMLDLLITAGLDEYTAENIIQELEEES